MIGDMRYSLLPQAGEGPGMRVFEYQLHLRCAQPLTPNPSPAYGRGE